LLHLLNTYYYFDVNSQQWLHKTAAILTNNNNGYTKEFAMGLQMQPQKENIIYVKLDAGALKNLRLP